MRGAAAALFDGFDLILAQDDRAAARLRALGAHPAGFADLKYGAAVLPAETAKVEEIRRSLGGRPVILAASTHPGEDELVLQAFRALAGPDEALLVIAPRHPVRGPAIARTAEALGFKVGLQGSGDTAEEAQVLVADVLGELGLWFRLARLAVIGGSLVPGVGGHNPLEPARLSCPFVSGPFVDNWASTYAALVAADATRLVAPEALGEALARAISEPNAHTGMAGRAAAHVGSRDAEARGVAARILELLA
jgi:3-deoxy-D-manno-octulosonic-acid transferase